AIDGIPGVGDDDLVALLDQREQREEQEVLASRREHDVLRPGGHTGLPAHVRRGRLADLRYPARRRVVRGASVHGTYGCVDDVLRSREVRFPYLEMDDVATLRLQPAGMCEYLESTFRTQPRHAAGEVDAHAVTDIGGRSPPGCWYSTSTRSTRAETGPLDSAWSTRSTARRGPSTVHSRVPSRPLRTTPRTSASRA